MQVLGWARDQQNISLDWKDITQKVSIENADYVKRATGWRGNNLHGWHCFGQQTSNGTGRSAEGERPPTTLKCLSWVLLWLLWLGFVCLEYCTVWLSWCSVTHLLWDLVRVEDARDWHLDLVFLLLGLAKGCLPLLQEQVWGVLACKLLE